MTDPTIDLEAVYIYTGTMKAYNILQDRENMLLMVK